MPTVLEHPKLTDERIAGLIDEMIRKNKLDPKQIELDLAESTTKIRDLQPTLMALEAHARLPEIEGIMPFPIPLGSTFAKLARECLNLVTVVVRTPSILDIQHFNSGEMSLVNVEVRNTCDLPIRDVVVSLAARGPVTVLRQYRNAIVNPRHIAKLQPGVVQILPFFVLAQEVTDIVSAKLYGTLSAEVVPYVNHIPVSSLEFDVWPAT